MRIGSAFVLIIALALGGLAAYLARAYLQNQTAPSVEHVQSTVVVASQALPFGAALTADNTLEVPWPAEAGVSGAFPTKAELFKDGKRIVLSPIERNEPVLASKITGAGQRATLSTLIEEGMRAVTIRVDEVRGVAGFILPSDRVDVVLTRGEDNNREGQAFADVLLQNVKVLAIDQLAGDKTDKPTVARAVTLELDAQQAQKVILAQGVGRLSLILNKAGNSVARTTTRVTVADLGPTGPSPAEDEAKAQVARLEARIEALKQEAERNGASNQEAFLNRMGELEARLQAELKRSQVKPEPVAAPAPVVQDLSKLVNVVRNGNKREQYSVAAEAR